MQRFKDIHKGKRIWVLASGPSLAELPVDQIPEGDIIIACNSAVMKAKRLNYACFTDGAVIGYNYYHDLKHRDCKVISFNETEIFPIKEETYYVKKREDRDNWKFSKDDTEVIFGYDVVQCAIHLAYMMGGSIILCGVDLRVSGQNYHWHDREKVALVSNEHLHPTWGHVDIKYNFGMEHGGFLEIKKANPDLDITNISPRSRLHAFTKKTFYEVLAK